MKQTAVIQCILTKRSFLLESLAETAAVLNDGDESFLICPHCCEPFAAAEKTGSYGLNTVFLNQHAFTIFEEEDN